MSSLKQELAAEWHKLVTGTSRDLDRVLDWIIEKHEMETLMTLRTDVTDALTKLDALTTAVAAISAPDLSTVAKADALAAVATDVAAIKAEVVMP